jgi:hypothetical protein
MGDNCQKSVRAGNRRFMKIEDGLKNATAARNDRSSYKCAYAVVMRLYFAENQTATGILHGVGFDCQGT